MKVFNFYLDFWFLNLVIIFFSTKKHYRLKITTAPRLFFSHLSINAMLWTTIISVIPVFLHISAMMAIPLNRLLLPLKIRHLAKHMIACKNTKIHIREILVWELEIFRKYKMIWVKAVLYKQQAA